MKKVIMILLSLALCLSFVSCGGNKNIELRMKNGETKKFTYDSYLDFAHANEEQLKDAVLVGSGKVYQVINDGVAWSSVGGVPRAYRYRMLFEDGMTLHFHLEFDGGFYGEFPNINEPIINIHGGQTIQYTYTFTGDETSYTGLDIEPKKVDEGVVRVGIEYFPQLKIIA